jgi:hypothetical protein
MPWSTTRTPGTQAKYETAAHRKARADLLSKYRPGDPCCLCGHPMWPPTSGLHADHLPGTDEYRGLAHGTAPCQDCGQRCNVKDGARRGNARSNGQGRRRWVL